MTAGSEMKLGNTCSTFVWEIATLIVRNAIL
jgi:hypothetical protein